MTQDVSQWLAEIRTLQRQLADTRKERDQAFASAANWRRLYETEARQRRHEVQELRSQLQAQQPTAQSTTAQSPVEPSDSLSQSQSPPQDPLTAALDRCQELSDQLAAERQAHDRTRQTLTMALGEAFDTLKHPASHGPEPKQPAAESLRPANPDTP